MTIKKIIRRTSHISSHQLLDQLPSLLQRVFLNRGISSSHELQNELQALLPFDLLLNIDQAVDCLIDALTQQQRILIIGDFDADGATSTALAVSCLKTFGAKYVDYLVPNRFTLGYGLTPEIVAIAANRKPDLLITVDNGISSHAGVAAAKALGMKVLITDHHLAPENLPGADAIVNPNQPGDKFPSKNLAGVGVIFYVMLALRKRCRDINWFTEQHINEPNMAQFLDLVALGTVADVVQLDQNNRILVYQGLRRIRSQQCRFGIQALLQISQRSLSKLSATDLGFTVAPRLNAAGRLDDMSLGIACLLSDNFTHALELAMQLDNLNKERRSIETEMLSQAEELLKPFALDTQSLKAAICLYDPEWHQGVIGILAGRIKDKYHRPTIVFAQSNETELKGSARSISSIHLRDTLSTIATQYPELITKFGGHAMAAGLTIKQSDFELFTEIFTEQVARQLTSEDLQGSVLSDGELAHDDFTVSTADLFREFGPWGQGFPEPLFDGCFKILQQRTLSDKHLKFVLQPSNSNLVLNAIAFNQTSVLQHQSIQAAYKLDINEYNGQRQVQLIIEHFEPVT